MAESSDGLIKLTKLIDELLKDVLPNNWNPLTFKEFVHTDKTKTEGIYYVSDWSKRYLMSNDGMRSGMWVNDGDVWRDGIWSHNNDTWVIDNPFDDWSNNDNF